MIEHLKKKNPLGDIFSEDIFREAYNSIVSIEVNKRSIEEWKELKQMCEFIIYRLENPTASIRMNVYWEKFKNQKENREEKDLKNGHFN
jgi:hypothetical protein